MLSKILIFLIFNVSLTYGVDCTQFKDDCQYYLCMESKKKCGRKGYLKSFGYKYCKRFSDQKKYKYSDETINWINQTRNCLIESIDQLSPKLSCRQFKNQSFKQHKSCYLNSGYCSLSKVERKKIANTIGLAILKPRILFSGLKILHSCNKNSKVMD